MFSKEEKKSLTRLLLLSIGWGIGLDRFYDGKAKEGILSIIGWSLVLGSLFYFSPCHSGVYADGVKSYSEMNVNPLALIPLGFGIWGFLRVIRKGFKLLRSFETS